MLSMCGSVLTKLAPTNGKPLGELAIATAFSGTLVGTQLTDDFLQIRAGGDQALFQGLGKYLLEAEAQGRKTPGLSTVLDDEFINNHTVGINEYLRQLEKVEWDDIVDA